ncbi:MAG TPA: hypothetical protein VF170_00380 [Planctomycetaceae bacterium]
MKPDERRLLEELRRRAGGGVPQSPRDVAAELGVSPKRCLLLCQGWWAKRWLERSPDAGRGEDFVTGRLTEAGMTAALDGE